MGTFETAQKGEALIQEYYDLTERKVPVWLEWIPYIAGTKHETFQLHYGDCIIHIGESGRRYCEVKAERANKYKNLFIEIWSNKSIGRKGWFFNLIHTDLLYYVFLREQVIYVVDFKKLKTFDISKYPEKVQTTHEQDNDSWGRCVPIVALEAAGVIFATRNMNELRARAAK